MDRALLGEIRRMLAPLERRVKLAVSRAIVTLVNDGTGIQTVQGTALKGEVIGDDTEHMQPGGLSHKSLASAEGLFVSQSGVRDDGVWICISDRRYRPKDIEDGDTIIYNEGERQSTIWFQKKGAIEISARTGGGEPSRVSMRESGEIELFAALGGNPTTLLLKEDGSVKLTAGGGGNKSEATFGMDSSITLKNDNGSFQMAQDGTANINGFVIDPDGNASSPGTIQADQEITAMAASPATSVTLSQHVHPNATGDTSPAKPGT